jgi:DNA (cytosine-5)-methyltransferase 1
MQSKSHAQKPTAGSLFSGIGGIDLAFSLAGFDILFQVEIDEFCQKVLAKHSKEYWPNAEIFADVRAVGKHNLASIDVLFGGFPCQDISNAGKREGLVAGKRSSLWFEFARIIGEIRPRIVLLENVEAITTPRKGEDGEITPPDMAVVIDTLASMGYSARWGIIAAADAGAPHQRNRWFCVAYRQSKFLKWSEPKGAFFSKSEKEIGNRGSFTGETILREQRTMAYTPRRRFAEKRGYRIEARKRLVGTSKVGNANCESIQKQRQSFAVGAKLRASGCAGTGIAREDTSNQSRMGRDAHGLSAKLDGDRLMAHRWPAKPNEPQSDYEPPRVLGGISDRRSRIKALGNAVVPQVVYPIAMEIRKLLETGNQAR